MSLVRALVCYAFVAMLNVAVAQQTPPAAGAQQPAATPPAAAEAPAAATKASGNFDMPIAEIEDRLNNQPFEMLGAEISRPNVPTDITLKGNIQFPDGKIMKVKIRRAPPGGAGFNNEPRYELAAYELQKLFLGPDEYVVPPTALRFVKTADLKKFTKEAQDTLQGMPYCLVELQYWLQNVSAPDDAYDPARFGSDAKYRRYMAQLNMLTYLIGHKDKNLGNILLSMDANDPRLYSVDNGVAFLSLESDKGTIWNKMRVTAVPKDTAARFLTLNKDSLEKFVVLSEWNLATQPPTAVALTKYISRKAGVRRKGNQWQLGLTGDEIIDVNKHLVRLQELIRNGDLTQF